MALDNFEQELFDELNDYQSDLNMREEWEELEQKLPPEERRRKPFFWWFAGAFVLGAVAVGLMLFNGNDNLNGTSNEVKVIIENEELNINSSDPAITTNEDITKINQAALQNEEEIKRVELKKKPTRKSNLVRKTEIEIGTNNTNQLASNKTNQTTLSKYSENFSSTSNNTLTNSKYIRSKVISPGAKQNISNSVIPVIIISDNSSSEEQFDENQEAINTERTKAENEVMNAEKKEIVTNAKVASENPKEKSNQEKEITENKNKSNIVVNSAMTPIDVGNNNEVTNSKWFVTAAGIIGSSQIFGLSLNGANLDYTYLSSQLKLHYNIGPRSSIYSGIVIGEYRRLFEYDVTFIEDRTEDALSEIHYLIDGNINEVYENGVIKYQVQINGSSLHRHGNISIPIGYSIHRNNGKKITSQFDMGFIFSVGRYHKGERVYYNEENKKYEILNFEDLQTKSSIAYNHQQRYGYKVTEKLSIQTILDLQMEFRFKEIGQNSGLNSFWHIGVGLGAKYEL